MPYVRPLPRRIAPVKFVVDGEDVWVHLRREWDDEPIRIVCASTYQGDLWRDDAGWWVMLPPERLGRTLGPYTTRKAALAPIAIKRRLPADY